jgi:pyruvate,orthophosphate dikinase
MTKRVYLFDEGGKEDRTLLGNKGANLCEMTALGLPVPPGFIISTEACKEYFDNDNELPPGLMKEITAAIGEIEDQTGRKLGDPANPLLFSVRSGAPVSMPGMMDTVLNLGINDEISAGLARRTSNPRFANDTHRRFIQMFGNVVLGQAAEQYESILEATKARKGHKTDLELTAEDLRAIIREYRKMAHVPDDPVEQLQMAIKAVFSSWYTPRAIRYREFNNIPGDLGTAVSVQGMVFGNMGNTSGTGVAFTRNPATGEKRFFGEFLTNAEGEDVVSGIRTPDDLEVLQEIQPKLYGQLFQIQETLERHYRDMQDLEFTIEEGRLYILQTRTGKRTAKAAVKIAIDMVKEGYIDEESALARIDAEQMSFFMHPMIDSSHARTVIAKGLPASPGAATGKVVFSAEEAEQSAVQGERVIMVRRQTTPEDIHGMNAAVGILTQLGGMTSHAAVVARGMGKCCVSGCSEIRIDYERQRFTTHKGEVVKKFDVITLDGSTGEVILGEVPKIDAHFDEDFKTILSWADKYRRLEVRANAETQTDAEKARELGAEGIGLCRTEHMFFNEDRINVMRAMILADTDEARREALAELSKFQKTDMKTLFKVMDGLPVTIRTLDPPFNEFMPSSDYEIRVLADRLDKPFESAKSRIMELTETNPMLGFRGCRLSILHPEITRMQVEAIISAAAEVKKEGYQPCPEIMVPLVTSATELKVICENIKAVIAETLEKEGVSLSCPVGTMIEVPRACLRAKDIAPLVNFYSFGTNDLTQLVFGFSRDDVHLFLGNYLEQKIIRNDPFVTLDQRGVGSLICQAIDNSKPVNPELDFGICGEHGGNPRSVEFFHRIGLDYVSCSPFRVPIARIAAAQAAVAEKMKRKGPGRPSDGAAA